MTTILHRTVSRTRQHSDYRTERDAKNAYAPMAILTAARVGAAEATRWATPIGAARLTRRTRIGATVHGLWGRRRRRAGALQATYLRAVRHYPAAGTACRGIRIGLATREAGQTPFLRELYGERSSSERRSGDRAILVRAPINRRLCREFW
jgi:hypothetical protein